MVNATVTRGGPVLLFPGNTPNRAAGLVRGTSTSNKGAKNRAILHVAGMDRPAVAICPTPSRITANTTIIIYPNNNCGVLTCSLRNSRIYR